MDSQRTFPDPSDVSLASFHPIIAHWFQDTIGTSDSLNLVGIILPGDRIPAFPSRSVVYRHRVLVASEPLTNISA